MANAGHQRRAETMLAKHDPAVPRVRWMAWLGSTEIHPHEMACRASALALLGMPSFRTYPTSNQADQAPNDSRKPVPE